MFPITRTLSESDRSDDYVAFGVLINPNTGPYHSSFIIQFENELHLCHYTGRSIEFGEVNDDYFHRVSGVVEANEVPAFISFCKNVTKKANPRYGFFFSGESYDKITGKHLSNKDLGEFMTCVGFCLNIINGFLEEEQYLKFEDWNTNSHSEPGYLDWFCNKHGLDKSKIQTSHRRITPIECLSSAFFDELPISKHKIDSKIPYVKEYFTRVFNEEEE